jgi:(p)ppGpp synthase/HD superfamily hydrolase
MHIENAGQHKSARHFSFGAAVPRDRCVFGAHMLQSILKAATAYSMRRGEDDMYYSELVKKACVLMFEAHKNDFDKGGYPYVFHPFYLATQMEDEASTCVALLHDVIEDHGDEYTYTDLESAGFPKEVLDALHLLTHADGVAYMDYVKALAENPIARKVKLADLKHNLDSRRLSGQKPAKNDTYLQAIAYLARME